ncbi:MAG: class II fructose-bisphosphate aldolase [Firmicutes bacterium]|nr:class II fructose-bisphosphate aldolase [Bacillota bacterium]
MAIVSLREVLQDAMVKRYAVGSFNAADHSMAEAILEVSEERNVPVILSVAEVHFRYLNLERFIPYLRQRIETMATPVVLHLDHGLSLDTIVRGLDLGFSSVMIDASSLPYEENVALTSKVVELARGFGASVEAELGHVGGGEGNLTDGTEADPSMFTDPKQAAAFVRATGVDALAVAIGTVHGPYKGDPQLDLDLLKEIRSLVDVPLVLHGGSGLSRGHFQSAIANGITKINYFTEGSLAAVEEVRRVLATGTPIGYPDLIGVAKRRVKEIISEQIEIFGTGKP